MDMADANVRDSEALALLRRVTENIWNFYFSLEYVRIMGKLNSKWQSHTKTVIDAEIELQAAEERLNSIDDGRLPLSVTRISHRMEEKEEKDSTKEQQQKRQPWMYIKNRARQLCGAFLDPDISIYKQNKTELMSSLSGETFKSRHVWQLYFSLFNFKFVFNDDFDITNVMTDTIFGLKHLKDKYKLENDQMNRNELIQKLFDRLKVIGLNCDKENFTRQYKMLLKVIIKKYKLKDTDLDNNTYYIIICDLVNTSKLKTSKSIKKIVSEIPDICKCLLFIWDELYSNGVIEQYGHYINLAKGPLQHRMKVLLLDCLLQIMINGPRLGYCENLIARCITLGRELGMLSAIAPFKSNKIPVCQRIATQTTVNVNKNKLGGRAESLRQTYIKNRNRKDKQCKAVFGEGLADISQLLGVRTEQTNDKKSDE